MPYHVAVGRRVLPLAFERIDDAYAYVLSVADWDPHADPERWALVLRKPGAPDEVVVPAGRLGVEARRWREQHG